MKYTSNLLAQASGSVNGSTFSRNQGGSYIRNRSIPTNPNSPAQQSVRTFFKQMANAWTNTLTAAQRLGWKTYATNVPLPNSLGQPRKINDNAMYQRSNVSRLQAGLARIDDAPGTYDLGTFTQPTFAVTHGSTSLGVTFTTGDSWHATGGALLLYVSTPQNGSINFFKGPFKFVGAITGAATSPATFTMAAPAGGTASALFVKTVATQVDGRLSTESIVKSTPA